MKPSLPTLVALLTLFAPVLSITPNEGAQRVLDFVRENALAAEAQADGARMGGQEEHAPPMLLMKAEAGKGSRDSKMVILGVAGAAGVFALGLL